MKQLEYSERYYLALYFPADLGPLSSLWAGLPSPKDSSRIKSHTVGGPYHWTSSGTLAAASPPVPHPALLKRHNFSTNQNFVPRNVQGRVGTWP